MVIYGSDRIEIIWIVIHLFLKNIIAQQGVISSNYKAC